jgi:hypothetical protein
MQYYPGPRFKKTGVKTAALTDFPTVKLPLFYNITGPMINRLPGKTGSVIGYNQAFKGYRKVRQ